MGSIDKNREVKKRGGKRGDYADKKEEGGVRQKGEGLIMKKGEGE